MITMEQMGLDEAADITDFMRTAITEYAGCYYRGSTREEKPVSNGTIVRYLRDNIPRRDLSSFSDDDAEKFGLAWQVEIERAVNQMTKKSGGWKKTYLKKGEQGRAKIAAGRAWKAAGRAVLLKMQRRLIHEITADDSGTESPAEKVSRAYALRRQALYGVSEEAVYVATGQLMNDLSPDTAGNVTLVKGTAAIGRDEMAAEIQSGIKAGLGLFGVTGKGI